MSELQCNIRKQRDDGDMHERVMVLAVLVWVCDGDSASKWWCEWVIVRVSDVWWCEWVMVVWVSVGVSECWCECCCVWVSDGVSDWWCWQCMKLHDRNIMIVLFIARLRKQKWISFLQEIPYQNNGEVMSFISQGKHTVQLQSVDSANHSYHARPQLPVHYVVAHYWLQTIAQSGNTIAIYMLSASIIFIESCNHKLPFGCHENIQLSRALYGTYRPTLQ